MMLRKLYYAPRDLRDRLRGKRSPLTPPSRMVTTIGGGDFEQVGREFLDLFVQYGKLSPQAAVLDVGCGVGRMAIPLTRYLTPEGRYEGFDIAADEIRWCQKHITPRFPNFTFQVSDVFNTVYNPTGTTPAHAYTFPFPDATFDFVFLTSVFTHMLPRDLERYLSEIVRVTRPGSRTFITYFLLTEASRGLIDRGESSLDFRHAIEGCLTTDPSAPEAALAYPEEGIREMYRRHGLRIEEPVYYGSWCGRGTGTTYQDVLIGVREP